MPSKKTRAEIEKELRALTRGGWTSSYKERLMAVVEQLDDPFPSLISIVESKDKDALHASWALSTYACQNLDKAINYVKELVKLADNADHDGIRKEVLRVLKDLSPIEEWETTLLDLAYRFLQSPEYSKAVHYYSLDIAFLTTMKFPELFGEYKTIIDDTLSWGSKPFLAKVGRYEVKLKKKAASTS